MYVYKLLESTYFLDAPRLRKAHERIPRQCAETGAQRHMRAKRATQNGVHPVCAKLSATFRELAFLVVKPERAKAHTSRMTRKYRNPLSVSHDKGELVR